MNANHGREESSRPRSDTDPATTHGVSYAGAGNASHNLEDEYIVACDRVTGADVLRAIEEYDQLGPERFFSEHGFAPTTTYELVWEKKPLPAESDLGHSL